MAGNLLSTESEESLYQQINTCSRNLAACSPVVVADAGDHLARAAHVHLLDGQLALVVADHAEEAVRVEVEGAVEVPVDRTGVEGQGSQVALAGDPSLVPDLTVAMQFSSDSYTSDWMSGRRVRRSKLWIVPSPLEASRW